MGGAAVRERQGWKSALRFHIKEAEQHAEHKPSPPRHLWQAARLGASRFTQLNLPITKNKQLQGSAAVSTRKNVKILQERGGTHRNVDLEPTTLLCEDGVQTRIAEIVCVCVCLREPESPVGYLDVYSGNRK